MKILLIMSLGALLFSCGGSNKNSSGGSHSDSQTDPVQTGSKFRATVQSRVKITQREITFLEDKNAEQGGCYISTTRDSSYPFELSDDELILKEQDREIVLTRASGNRYSIKGKWTREDSNRNGKVTLTFEVLDYDNIRMTNICERY